MMADDDYESLPESSAISAHMLAGAAAGISEHCLMYPVDCVKVRIYKHFSKNFSKQCHIILEAVGLRLHVPLLEPFFISGTFDLFDVF